MSYHAILFDLDGTLLDTLDDLADATNRALRTLGFPEHPVAAYKYFIGDGVENLVRRVLPADRCEPALMLRCATQMRQEYAQRWAVKTHPYPGVPELLDALCARGVPMAVLSNKPDEFTGLCVGQLLSRWRFDVVLGERPPVPKKPDPAGALEVASRLGLPPGQILYLGDTNTDMRTAVAAGMFPVGALWGFRTADELLAHGARVLVESPLEVLKILDGSSQICE